VVQALDKAEAATTTRSAGLNRDVVEELVRRRGEPEWLRAIRLEALAAYERLPVPTQQTEGWRRTSLAGLHLDAQHALPTLAADEATTGAAIDGQVSLPELAHAAGVLVQRDGRTVAADGLAGLAERGVVLMDLAEASRHPQFGERVRERFAQTIPVDRDIFTALHYAFFNAGVFVYVPRGVVLEQPLWTTHVFGEPGLATLSHTLLIVEDGAQATYVDDYSAPPRGGAPVASSVVEQTLGRQANVRYVNLQRWATDVWSFSAQRAHLAADASLRTLNVALGARLARTSVQAVLEGRGSQADILGIVAADGRQHVDFQTLQDHYGNGTRSDLVIYNALRGRSSSNFTGLIVINKPAHGTESSQQQKNVLLSTQARADSDPKLEILNNDVVRCTHGASVGPVDPEMLFYLQSRGVSHEGAERLIVEGFFQSVLEKMQQPGLHAAVWSAVEQKLPVGSTE